MDRRHFLSLSTAAFLGINILPSCSLLSKRGEYSVVILGDTHFDTEPDTVYHSNYNEPTEWLNRVQREEFARNGEMWRERCPRLVKRAAGLAGKDTRMTFQMGDLIQGDCGSGQVHEKMLDDVMNNFKGALGGLPFVTVVGNHDIRGTDAEATYHRYMPQRMSQELGKDVTKTTFSFMIDDDAYIVLDFNTPDDAEIEKLLKETEGARKTFVITHGPLFPYDGSNCRWFFHGSADEKNTQARRHFRELFARRQATCLCGHTHGTELADWEGDGGRITQMTMNSVWSKDELAQYTVNAEGAATYGELRKKLASMPNGGEVQDETPIFDEYRPGLRRYSHSLSAGSYRMDVSNKGVTIDFYGGDSQAVSHTFTLR